VFVLPLAVIQVALRVPFPGYQNWADFFSWLVFFLYGYVLLSDPRFARAIKKQGKIALFSGIACFLVMMAWMSSTTLLVSIQSALQANWQKSIFSSQCKSHALVGCLEQNLLLRN
jgi:hypothetical protein